jgi:hypothetical protein
MGFDKVMHEIPLGGPEKLARMISVDLISSIKSISVSWCKGQRRVRIEFGHTLEGVSNNFVLNLKLVW